MVPKPAGGRIMHNLSIQNRSRSKRQQEERPNFRCECKNALTGGARSMYLQQPVHRCRKVRARILPARILIQVALVNQKRHRAPGVGWRRQIERARWNPNSYVVCFPRLRFNTSTSAICYTMHSPPSPTLSFLPQWPRHAAERAQKQLPKAQPVCQLSGPWLAGENFPIVSHKTRELLRGGVTHSDSGCGRTLQYTWYDGQSTDAV